MIFGSRYYFHPDEGEIIFAIIPHILKDGRWVWLENCRRTLIYSNIAYDSYFVYEPLS